MSDQEQAEIRLEFAKLKQDHADFDAAINAMIATGCDPLQIQRMKKKKLALQGPAAHPGRQDHSRHHRLIRVGRCANRAILAAHRRFPLSAAFPPQGAGLEQQARRRRDHHGQPVRLGDDAPCRRDADALGVAHDKRIVSAHRTPERLFDFAKGAKAAGFKVIIAGAGGAAHLPGMTAALTPLPVFGVPVESKALSGPGFAAVDRPDAGRHSRRHARHRQGRRDQRRAAGRRRAGAVGRRRSPSGSTPSARRRRRRSPTNRRTRCDGSRCRPARPSASSAAASSAACWRWPPRGSATARSFSSRRPTARPRRSPTGRSSPPMTIRRRLAELARD